MSASNGTAWPTRQPAIRENNDHEAGLTIFPPGAVVVAGTVTAKVVSVKIEECDKLTYEVVWWSGESRCTATVNGFELQAVPDTDHERIGFRN